MDKEERLLLDQLHLLGLQISEEKKENWMTLIQVYMEVLKRCPSLGKIPKEEQLELIRILKEYSIL